MALSAKLFTPFKRDVSSFQLPEKFNFPFYYTPDSLSLLAMEELQEYLSNSGEIKHDFGLEKNSSEESHGKMFGVLVVENEAKELGYLSAFSGILMDNEHPDRFVPPIANPEEREAIIKIEMEKINSIGATIKELENAQDYFTALDNAKGIQQLASEEIQEKKQANKASKKARKEKRTQAESTLSTEAFETLKNELIDESYKDQFFLKHLIEHWDKKINTAQKTVNEFEDKINQFKENRKLKSNALQNLLYSQFQFLNINKETKNLNTIFTEWGIEKPPSGSGDCAAPRLLQYAFKNNFKPVAVAEFWWGKSPKSAIRKHKQFYPSCSGKCEPILSHMLVGLEVDPNPLLTNIGENTIIDILFEDEYLAIINKPADLLSVPGKNVEDSVYLRMQHLYPKATGPLIIHRLDQSTSGIMLIAKTKDAHKYLQQQFINRTIKKTYIALLDGVIENDNGKIDLPLRVDLDNRPNQLVCYEHGKPAVTEWEIISRANNQTKIKFFPITGRTHQLRVHAAHSLGLDTPIVGDDLYGNKKNRLHLHAASIDFNHPGTKEKMTYVLEPEF